MEKKPISIDSNWKFISGMLAAIAEECGDPKDWCDKYGTNYKNDIFEMHTYCWCDKDDCGYCDETLPNFIHKPTGFSVWWYKYIGRGMESNDDDIKIIKLADILIECIKSIRDNPRKGKTNV